MSYRFTTILLDFIALLILAVFVVQAMQYAMRLAKQQNMTYINGLVSYGCNYLLATAYYYWLL